MPALVPWSGAGGGGGPVELGEGIARAALSADTTQAVAGDTLIVSVNTLSAGAPVTVTLPPLADRAGRVLFVHDVTGDAATNAITVDPSGAEAINGGATLTINTANALWMIYAAAGQWRARQLA